ncbi:MAG: LysR family transcriptional regulator [Pasteurellaceae bacterium]|nr:LysR family transcriptional regulator [Pasteurellaceae bacterium]
MISLDDMALFVAVVNAKGFTQAADKLAIPKSTISVRIKKLEQALGLQLLNRTTRKIELTAEGEFYFERAQRLTTEADQTHQTLQTMLNEPAGVLRIALPIEFAQMFVAPLVPEFR